MPIAETTPQGAAAVFASALPVVPLEASFADDPGNASADNAAGIIEAIDRAVADVFSGLPPPSSHARSPRNRYMTPVSDFPAIQNTSPFWLPGRPAWRRVR